MPKRNASLRHLFTALLIVLAVGVCVLWVRSRGRLDVLALFVTGEGRAQVLASSRGRVCIALTNLRFGRSSAWTAMCPSGREYNRSAAEIVDNDIDVTRLQIYPPPDPAKVAAGGTPYGDGYLGFTFATSQAAVIHGLPDSKLAFAVVPHWAIALPLLGWASWRVFGPAARRQQRLKRGQCVQCGYDLRASTGRCPECGVAMPARAADAL